MAHQHQRSFCRFQLSSGHQRIILRRQSTDLPDPILRRKELGHNLSRLFRPELVGMENRGNASSLCRGSPSYLLNIFSPLIAQRSPWGLGLRPSFAVSNQIKFHIICSTKDCSRSSGTTLKTLLPGCSKRSQVQGARKIDERRRTLSVRRSEAIERNLHNACHWQAMADEAFSAAVTVLANYS